MAFVYQFEPFRLVREFLNRDFIFFRLGVPFCTFVFSLRQELVELTFSLRQELVELVELTFLRFLIARTDVYLNLLEPFKILLVL